MIMWSILDVSVVALIIYFFFSKKFSKMVDVLTARLQNRLGDLINRDSERNLNTTNQIISAVDLPLFAKIARDRHRQEQQRKRELNKKQINTKFLLSIKEKEWGVFLATRNRPLQGLSCTACVPDSRNSLNRDEYKASMLQNVLSLRDPPRNSGILAYLFNHIYSLCRLKKYEYPLVFDSVLSDERVIEAIETTARETLHENGEVSDENQKEKLIKLYTDRAAKILKGMRATVSDIIFKIVGWLTYKILARAITSIAVHPCQIKMLEAAKERGLPIIYLPLHRSHLDYTTISLTLQCFNFKSPLVASGDNLKIPVFEWFLRNIGAFYIKRRIDPVEGRKDILYRTILHTYMTEALKAGYDIEFFIEGGRSRTGKPAIPKGGLLSIIVDAYVNGTIEDALLVPISINYERLVDGNFTREQLGEPKEPETFWGAMSAIYQTFTSYYGMMRVDFNQPFSLKELVTSFEKQLKVSNKTLHVSPSSSSFHGTGCVSEDQRQMVTSIATHIVYDCCQSMAVMSTNAVSFLLLSQYRNGVTLEELVDALDKLRKNLEWDNRDVGFTGKSTQVVNHAIKLLGPGLVEQVKSSDGNSMIIKPVLQLPNIIELSYYSNTLVPHYIMTGVVVTALYSLFKDDFELAKTNPEKPPKPSVKQIELLRHSLKLCDILQYDFIFTKPCQYLDTVVISAVEKLISLDILTQKEELLMEEEQWSHRFAKRLQEEEDFDDYDSDEYGSETDDHPGRFNNFNDERNSPVYEINFDSVSMKHLEFYHNIVQPYIESYSVSAECLDLLVNNQVQERAHVMTILGQIKTQLSEGVLKFSECAAVDQIRNSLKLFEKWLVLECFTQDKIKLLYLNDEYDSQTELKPIIERITCFR